MRPTTILLYVVSLLFLLELPRFYLSKLIGPIYAPLINLENFVRMVSSMEEMMDFAFQSIPFSRRIFVRTPIFDRPYAPSAITIYFGASDGVSYGDALVAMNCLVGKVVKVSEGRSLAYTLYNPNMVIPVMDSRSGYLAVVYGGREPVVEYLEGMDIGRGDTLITSGVEGIFPAGLLVGVVDSIHFRDRGFVRRFVNPICPIHRLMRFHIVRRSE